MMRSDDPENGGDVEINVDSKCMEAESEMVKIQNSEDGDRMQWGNPLQFFCTLLGYCVGLGNIWRFPYLCQQNGGGKYILNVFHHIFIEHFFRLTNYNYYYEFKYGNKKKRNAKKYKVSVVTFFM